MKHLVVAFLSLLLWAPSALAAPPSNVERVFMLANEARDVLLKLHRKHQLVGDPQHIAAMDADAARIDQLLYDIQMLTQAQVASRPQVAPVSITINVPGRVVVQPAPAPGPVYVQPAPVCQPMEHGRFQQVISAMQAESFSDGMNRILADASYGAFFSVAQVKQVMSLYSFDDDKVDAAVSMYPQVCDVDGWFTVYQVLTFDSSRDDLRARTGR